MADTATKSQGSGKVDLDATIAVVNERERLVTGIPKDLISKGYAIADTNGLRFYSFERLVDYNRTGDIYGGIYFGILKDKTATSKRIAESGIPLFSWMRRGAELKAELTKKVSEDTWTMTVYGAENLDEMSKLAKELASKHKIDIKVVGNAELRKESYCIPSSGFSP